MDNCQVAGKITQKAGENVLLCIAQQDRTLSSWLTVKFKQELFNTKRFTLHPITLSLGRGLLFSSFYFFFGGAALQQGNVLRYHQVQRSTAAAAAILWIYYKYWQRPSMPCILPNTEKASLRQRKQKEKRNQLQIIRGSLLSLFFVDCSV